MGTERTYPVGKYWLAKRRDGKAPDIWQIASYAPASRSIVYRSTKCRSLEDAKDVILAYEASQRASKAQPIEAAELLPQLFLYWREHGQHVRNPYAISGSLRAFMGFLDHEGMLGLTVADLSPELIDRFIAWRRGPHSYAIRWGDKIFEHQSQGVKGESIKRNLEDLRAAVRHAERYRRIPYAPRIQSVPDSMRSPRRKTKLSVDQLGAIMAYVASDKPMWRWVCLMIGTAIRPDAGLAFNPAEQWEGGTLDLHPPAWPRTKKVNPIIPVAAPLVPILQDWKANPHAPVKSRRTAWRKMRAALGLGDMVVPKTIRHSVATELTRCDVPGDQIEMLLGHRIVKSTTAVYAEYRPSYMAEAALGLASLFKDVEAAAHRWSAGHERATIGNRRGLVIDRNSANE